MNIELSEPLTAKEREELRDTLASIPGAMNLETVDGFFAMLHCHPETQLPSKAFPVAWGKAEEHPSLTKNIENFKHFVMLLTKYWNEMLHRLENGGFKPFLINKLSDGTFSGNDWAKGFVCGMLLEESKEIDAMIHDNEQSLAYRPIFALATENTHMAEMLEFEGEHSQEVRKELIDELSDCVPFIYQTLRTDIPKKKKTKTRKTKITI